VNPCVAGEAWILQQALLRRWTTGRPRLPVWSFCHVSCVWGTALVLVEDAHFLPLFFLEK